MKTAKKNGYTDFELKVIELDKLKTEVLTHMGKLNKVKIDYMDWFERKRQTFVDALKLIQITFPQLVPSETATIANFRKTYEIAFNITKNGSASPVGKCHYVMKEYLHFWERINVLHREGQTIYKKICDYCNGITRMREPHINETVDSLQVTLNEQLREDFNFMSVHNERDNLFTYKVAQHDHRFHGLLAYIPYLLKISTTICFWNNKIFLEKEWQNDNRFGNAKCSFILKYHIGDVDA